MLGASDVNSIASDVGSGICNQCMNHAFIAVISPETRCWPCFSAWISILFGNFNNTSRLDGEIIHPSLRWDIMIDVEIVDKACEINIIAKIVKFIDESIILDELNHPYHQVWMVWL